MKDVEIEIQVRISEPAHLQKFLQDKAEFVSEDYQKDEYFTPAHRDFASVKPIAEWLRLRSSNKDAITYKKWHYEADGTSNFCDEYESSVGSLEQMRKIFTALDIRPLITVEKMRKTWRYNEYEIALDRVTGLGDFVEIEYKAATGDTPKAITDKMVRFLHDIDCGTIERNYVGYPFQLLYPGEATFETV